MMAVTEGLNDVFLCFRCRVRVLARFDTILLQVSRWRGGSHRRFWVLPQVLQFHPAVQKSGGV